MDYTVQNEKELLEFGGKLGALLKGGELLELSGDVGAGKTTLVKAIALGMGINETVTSPSYTLSQAYDTPSGLRLVHYDFYRLDDPGILAAELQEVFQDKNTVVAIEWSGIVADILLSDRLQIRIEPTGESSRQLLLTASGGMSKQLLEQLA